MNRFVVGLLAASVVNLPTPSQAASRDESLRGRLVSSRSQVVDKTMIFSKERAKEAGIGDAEKEPRFYIGFDFATVFDSKFVGKMEGDDMIEQMGGKDRVEQLSAWFTRLRGECGSPLFVLVDGMRVRGEFALIEDVLSKINLLQHFVGISGVGSYNFNNFENILLQNGISFKNEQLVLVDSGFQSVHNMFRQGGKVFRVREEGLQETGMKAIEKSLALLHAGGTRVQVDFDLNVSSLIDFKSSMNEVPQNYGVIWFSEKKVWRMTRPTVQTGNKLQASDADEATSNADEASSVLATSDADEASTVQAITFQTPDEIDDTLPLSDFPLSDPSCIIAVQAVIKKDAKYAGNIVRLKGDKGATNPVTKTFDECTGTDDNLQDTAWVHGQTLTVVWKVDFQYATDKTVLVASDADEADTEAAVVATSNADAAATNAAVVASDADEAAAVLAASNADEAFPTASGVRIATTKQIENPSGNKLQNVVFSHVSAPRSATKGPSTLATVLLAILIPAAVICFGILVFWFHCRSVAKETEEEGMELGPPIDYPPHLIGVGVADDLRQHLEAEGEA